MGEAAKALGKGSTIKWKGQQYSLAPIDIDMLAMLELWAEARAWDKVERTKGQVPEDRYRERHDAVTRLVATGAFDHNGPIMTQLAESKEARDYLTGLQLMRANRELTPEDVQEMFNSDLREILARINADAFDPNSRTPESPGQ